MANPVPYVAMEVGTKPNAPKGAIPINLFGDDFGGSGTPGPQGAQGEPGPAGEAGPQGPAGPAGIDGAQGPAGPRGDTGERGTSGDLGQVGPQGPPGTSISVEGYLPTLADRDALALTLTQDDTGKGWFVVEDQHIYFWAGTDFVDGGKIGGPQGIPGVDGERGDTGPRGLPGDPGERGAQGAQGIQGPAGEKGDPGADAALPSGGLSGQVLTKTGAGDGQVAWTGEKVMVTGNFQGVGGSVSLNVGPWVLSLFPNGTNLPLLRIRSRTGTIQTDYGSVGAPAAGEGSAFARVRRNEAVTTTSTGNVSPGMGICTFYIRRTGADEVWEGSAFCPSPTGLAIIKAERIL